MDESESREGDSEERQADCDGETLNPLIAICHPTARPEGWHGAYRQWCEKASGPFEYVLSMDAKQAGCLPKGFGTENHRTAINHGMESCNAAWNAAAAESTAPVIVLAADDMIPPDNWDVQILEAIKRAGKKLTDDFVIWVSTDNPFHHDQETILLPILSRVRYLKYGYAVCDEYPSVYSDNDFTEMAQRDGVIIEARELIKFSHQHYTVTGEEPDEVYSRQNSPEKYRIGAEILARRRASGFPAKNQASKTLSIAVCLPGQSFTNEWLANWTQLFAYLMAHAHVQPLFGYAPNPHITRAAMAHSVLNLSPVPELVLWIDHDNLVSIADFNRLLTSLNEHPEADGIAGWCWWGQEHDLKVSCGRFDQNGKGQLFSPAELFSGLDVKEIGFSGFPCFLMKGETLRKAGKRPFLPVLSDEYPWGFAPEDIAFCKSATDHGCRFFVDRRVEVEHRKLQSLRPREERKSSVA